MAENLLKNPGFENWSMVMGVLPGGGWHDTQPANDWIVEGNCNGRVDRESGEVYSGKYSMKILTFGDFVSRLMVDQRPTEFYKGKELVFAVYIKTDQPNFVRIGIEDTINQSYSPYHSGSNLWELLTVTHKINPDTTGLYFTVSFDTGKKGVAYLDSAVVFKNEELIAEKKLEDTSVAIAREIITEQKIESTEQIQAVVSTVVETIQQAAPPEVIVKQPAPEPPQPIPEIKITEPIDLSKLTNYAQQLVSTGMEKKEAIEFVVKNALPESTKTEMAENIEELKKTGMPEDEAVANVVNATVKSKSYVPYVIGFAVISAIGLFLLRKKDK